MSYLAELVWERVGRCISQLSMDSMGSRSTEPRNMMALEAQLAMQAMSMPTESTISSSGLLRTTGFPTLRVRATCFSAAQALAAPELSAPQASAAPTAL